MRKNTWTQLIVFDNSRSCKDVISHKNVFQSLVEADLRLQQTEFVFLGQSSLCVFLDGVSLLSCSGGMLTQIETETKKTGRYPPNLTDSN